MNRHNLSGLVAPSRRNAYRPYLLRSSSLTFFLGLILLGEAALAGAQFQSPAVRATLAAAAAAPSPTSLESQGLKQFSKILSDPQASIDWFLGAVAVIIAALIIFALVLRPQVQPMHALAPAFSLLCLALLLLAINAAVVGNAGAQTAAVQSIAR